jgi:guanylate kinase
MEKKLLVVCGPSGAGLGEIVKRVFALRPDTAAATPVTARKPKAGETDGVGFWFYDLEGWNALMESGDLLEATEFAGNDYGTSRRRVTEQLDAGKNVLLNLPVERAAQLKRNMPEAVCVYVEPSEEVLKQRYEAIARSSFELAVRLEQAEKERALSAFCDKRICSDDADKAVEEILGEMKK